MNIHEIAKVETCYVEKFGTPRQSGVVSSAWGRIVFSEEYQNVDYIRGLEGFSHLWLVFVFHESIKSDVAEVGVKATVRPPRLGGNEKVGVFASRSPFRPNPIGLSLARIEKIEQTKDKGSVIHISGVDLVSDTPLLDVKPYIPYCDSVGGEVSDNVCAGYVQGAPEKMAVMWEKGIDEDLNDDFKKLIEETLAVDPRPAYHDDEREYGCLVEGINVRWKVKAGGGDDYSGKMSKVVKILSCAQA